MKTKTEYRVDPKTWSVVRVRTDHLHATVDTPEHLRDLISALEFAGDVDTTIAEVLRGQLDDAEAGRYRVDVTMTPLKSVDEPGKLKIINSTTPVVAPGAGRSPAGSGSSTPEAGRRRGIQSSVESPAMTLPLTGPRDPTTGRRRAALGTLIGKRFGSRVVMSAHHERLYGQSLIYCVVRCDCGSKQKVWLETLRSGMAEKCRACVADAQSKLSNAEAAKILRKMKATGSRMPIDKKPRARKEMSR